MVIVNSYVKFNKSAGFQCSRPSLSYFGMFFSCLIIAFRTQLPYIILSYNYTYIYMYVCMYIGRTCLVAPMLFAD